MVQSLQKVVCPFCLIILFIYCCTALFRISLVVDSGGYSLLHCGLFIVVTSPVAQHRLQTCKPQQLCTQAWQLRLEGSRQSTGSIDVAHRFSCSELCGIFLGQGSNPCPLHQQADSYPLHCQRSPVCPFLNKKISAYYMFLQYHS